MDSQGQKKDAVKPASLLFKYGSSLVMMVLGAVLATEAVLQVLFGRQILFAGPDPSVGFLVGVAVIVAGTAVRGWKA